MTQTSVTSNAYESHVSMWTGYNIKTVCRGHNTRHPPLNPKGLPTGK
jgi:hypothetical protein